MRVKGLSQIGSKLENLFFNKHPFARDGLRAGHLRRRRAKGPAAYERTRNRGWGQDPGCKGDKVHRVSRRYEVATRVSPGAQLAHHRRSAAGGWLPQAGAAHGEEATAAGANSNARCWGMRKVYSKPRGP